MKPHDLLDPAIAAAAVVFAYGIASAQAYSLAKLSWRRRESRARMAWGAVSVVLLLLALSYQLDLIPRGIASIKGVAKEQGWYQFRRPLAAAGIGLVIVIAAFSFFKKRRDLRNLTPARFCMAAGGLFFTAYFLLRATSIHEVDPWLGIHFGCPQSNGWFEVLSAAILAVGFRWRRRELMRAGSQCASREPLARRERTLVARRFSSRRAARLTPWPE
jgi:hypothetical protein